MTTEVTLHFKDTNSSIGVTAHQTQTGIKRNFRISPEILPSIFGNSWRTGYFAVSQDGPIFLENRGDKTLVVVQRALRREQNVRWGTSDLVLTTPWTVFIFAFAPNADSDYTLHSSQIYTTTGPALGGFTRLCPAQWLGNVYADHRVCWGSTAVGDGGTVSLASATNFVNDFFYQPFNSDLARSPNLWKEFTETERLPRASIGSLDSIIERFWSENH